jgi:hypothetical protein
MPKKAGTTNYNNEIFISIVNAIKPAGAEAWRRVAILYQQETKEASPRDHEDLKRHWTEKLCNKFKKPTGKSGEAATDRVFRCQLIQKAIQEEAAAVMMGGSDSEDVEEDYNHFEENLGTPSTTACPLNAITASTDEIVASASPSIAQPALAPVAQQSSAPAAFKSTPVFTNTKTKNSGSVQRGSIAKTLDNVAQAMLATASPPQQSNHDILLLMMQQQQQQFMMFMQAFSSTGKRKRNIEDDDEW